MAEEDFVKKEEFNNLKKDVEKIKDDMVQNAKTLASIDGKIDIIKERITSADEISDLKLKPLDKRVENLEDTQKWLWRAIAGTSIGLILGLIFEVAKFIK